MRDLFNIELISSIFDSLGWALIHSIWQGALAAIFVMVMRFFTSNDRPGIRFTLQFTALITCFVAFIATFATYFGGNLLSPTSGAGLAQFLTPSNINGLDGNTLAGAAQSISSGADFVIFAPVIGLIWCIGFCLMSTRYVGAYLMTRQLRRNGLRPVSAHWETRFRTLILNAGISEKTRLYISDRVSGPMTLGFFKPIVLVPVGFLTRLPADQVEAILLHEIAHIRRYDYLINLIQTAIKTVFFFHPAVHYICRQIDNDREQACDDLAVKQSGNARALARGLAALRLNLDPPHLALSADNGRTPLTIRLNRLIGNTDRTRRPDHLILSAITVALIGTVSLATAPLADAGSPEKETTHPKARLSNYVFETITVDGQNVTAKIATNGTRWINVDGRWYDVDKSPEMAARIPAVPPNMPKAPKLFDEDTLSSASPEKLQKLLKKQKKALDQYEINVEYYQAELERYAADEQVLSKKALNQLEREAERREQDVEKTFALQQSRIEADIESRTEAKAAAEAEETRKARERSHEKMERDRLKAEKAAIRHEAFRDQITRQLLKDGLIKSKDAKITITQDGKDTVINGTPIPHALGGNYCKIFDKHGIDKNPNMKFTFTPKSVSVKEKIIKAQYEPPRETQFTKPLGAYKKTAQFGNKGDLWPKDHNGVDLAAKTGTPVLATADGTVHLVTTEPAWGHRIIIKHGDRYQSLYGHLDSMAVKRGQLVTAGEIIGTVGSTGKSTGPHLHFEIREDGNPVNPEYLISAL